MVNIFQLLVEIYLIFEIFMKVMPWNCFGYAWKNLKFLLENPPVISGSCRLVSWFTNYNSSHNCSQDLNSLVSQSIVLRNKERGETRMRSLEKQHSFDKHLLQFVDQSFANMIQSNDVDLFNKMHHLWPELSRIIYIGW